MMPTDSETSRRRHNPAFRILGPLQVVGPKSPAQLAAPRQCIVLAMLLLEVDRILPVDRLVDAVWDEAPPPTARSQIQFCISAIRRTLADSGLNDVIMTRSPGYQLRVGDYGLDLRLFDESCATARTAVRARKLSDATGAYREALALWSGEPLAGIDSRLVRATAVQLHERRLAVLEECIELELRLGRHHEVVGELATYVANHPMRERLRAHLMVALYRCGRQAEALAVYRQARKDFTEELGLEPSIALRRLEHAILNQDSDLALAAEPTEISMVTTSAATPPRLLPPDVTDFTGRTDIQDELARYLTDPYPGDDEQPGGRIVVIAGPGGVGKTALARRLAHLVGSHFPDGHLYAHLNGKDASREGTGRALERFLRAFGMPSSAIPDDMEERIEAYRNLLAGKRILVVLDDVQHEGDVLPLLPGVGRSAVLITSRFRLTVLGGARHVDLGVLSEDEAVQLLSTVIGRERVASEPDEAYRLATLCGCLPLALRISAARLAARPHWAIRQLRLRLTDERRRLDELVHHGLGVRPSLSVAYESLNILEQRLFRLLAVLDVTEFAAWQTAPLLDVEPLAAEDVLESIVDVRLLDAERAGETTRYRFHDLVQLYARELLSEHDVPAARQAALHRVLRAWLFLARAAHQRHYGGDYTILHSDAPVWTLPAAVVAPLVAEPIEWFERERHGIMVAIQQAGELGLDDLCWDLAMTSVTLFETRGYFDDWAQSHELALAVTIRTGNRPGQAAMQYSLGALDVARQRFGAAAERLLTAERMFEELGDPYGRALVLRHLAFIDRLNGTYSASAMKYVKALAGMREVGDQAGEAHALCGLAQVRLEQGDYERARKLLHRGADIARSTCSARVEAQLLYRLGEADRMSGDLAAAERMYRRVTKLAEENHDVIGEAYAQHGLAGVHLLRDRYVAAEEALSRALLLARECGERLLQARIHLSFAELDQTGERYLKAIRHLETARNLFERIGATPWSALTLRRLGEIYRGLGDTTAAEMAFSSEGDLRRRLHRA